MRERQGKEESTDNPLLKNLRGRWRPQYWPVLAFSSTGLTTWWHGIDCYDGLQFRERFKIETTTIFSMLYLENLPQKNLELLEVIRNRLISSFPYLSLLLPFPLSLFLSSPHFSRALSSLDARFSTISWRKRGDYSQSNNGPGQWSVHMPFESLKYVQLNCCISVYYCTAIT